MNENAVSDRVIATLRNDRIGRRLASLLFVWRLARAAKATLLSVWPPETTDSPGENYSLSNLFDLGQSPIWNRQNGVVHVESVTLGEASLMLKGYRDFRAVEGAQKLSGPKFRIPSSKLFADSPYILCTLECPIVLDDESEAEVDIQVRELFSSLVLNPKVSSAWSRLKSLYDLKDVVAVHLRRQDIVEVISSDSFDPTSRHGTKWKQFFSRRYLPFECFIDELAARDQPPVIIFSDDPVARATFEHLYKGMTLDVAAAVEAYAGLNVMQRDFLDFMMLGRCSTIIGSAESLFSRMPPLIFGKEFVDPSRRLGEECLIRDLSTILRLAESPTPARLTTAADLADLFGARMKRWRLPTDALEASARVWRARAS